MHLASFQRRHISSLIFLKKTYKARFLEAMNTSQNTENAVKDLESAAVHEEEKQNFPKGTGYSLEGYGLIQLRKLLSMQMSHTLTALCKNE